MSAFRIARAAPALRAQTVMFTRTYVPNVRGEGQTATSKGFSQREQAEEGQYIRKKEVEKLKEAQEKLAKAQADVEAQQKVVDSSKP